MRTLDSHSLAQAFARKAHKPVLVLGFPSDILNFDEIKKAAPYLNQSDHNTMQGILDGQLFIVCNSYKEMETLYDLTVGDDGPTAVNKYNGKCRIYALTISSTGEFLNENT